MLKVRHVAPIFSIQETLYLSSIFTFCCAATTKKTKTMCKRVIFNHVENACDKNQRCTLRMTREKLETYGYRLCDKRDNTICLDYIVRRIDVRSENSENKISPVFCRSFFLFYDSVWDCVKSNVILLAIKFNRGKWWDQVWKWYLCFLLFQVLGLLR